METFFWNINPQHSNINEKINTNVDQLNMKYSKTCVSMKFQQD